jgi:hypothetical protein
LHVETIITLKKRRPKAEIEVAAERLTRISELLASSKKQTDKNPGRNILTRAIDSTFALLRKYLPPLHWLVMALGATVMFLYAQVVAFTARLVSTGRPAVAKYSGTLCSGAVAP